MVGIVYYRICIISALVNEHVVIPLTDIIATPVIVGSVMAILVAVIGVVVAFVILAGAMLCMRKKKQKLSLMSQGM